MGVVEARKLEDLIRDLDRFIDGGCPVKTEDDEEADLEQLEDVAENTRV